MRLCPREALAALSLHTLTALTALAALTACDTGGQLESSAAAPVGTNDPSVDTDAARGPQPDEPTGRGGGVAPPDAPTGGDDPPAPPDPETPVEDNERFAPAAATLHRLTVSQYGNAVRALLGADVSVPTDLEADTPLHGFNAVGASELTISPRAAEQYETAALALAGQIVGRVETRGEWLGCDPAGADCLRSALGRLGRLAWRRPLAADETEALTQLALASAAELRDPWQGVMHGLSALLQSPDFLFRVERGEPDPEQPARRRYTSLEMASRLSFFLWNGPPDDALLTAGERGDLATEAGVRAAAERMLADPRAEAALTSFFGEYVHLDRLDVGLQKDPATFPQVTATLAASMKAEIEALFHDVAFTRDADFGEILTARRVFVNGELAALYGLPAPPDPAVHAPYDLPAGHPRGGLLATAGILALYAHNTITSPTLRGKFVVGNLLCVDIPPPPAGVVAQLPEGDGSPETMRDKVSRHRSDPTCNGCHQYMDPLGLALENFDAVGAYRTTEQGLPIDATGELMGETFQGAAGLGRALRETPDFGACLVRRMYRHATGHLENPGEEPAVRALVARLAEGGNRLKALAVETVASPGFRRVGEAN
jgi:hypothetical protein